MPRRMRVPQCAPVWLSPRPCRCGFLVGARGCSALAGHRPGARRDEPGRQASGLKVADRLWPYFADQPHQSVALASWRSPCDVAGGRTAEAPHGPGAYRYEADGMRPRLICDGVSARSPEGLIHLFAALDRATTGKAHEPVRLIYALHRIQLDRANLLQYLER